MSGLPENFEKAAKKLLDEGSIAVIPTDTVYGIVARAADETAVGKLYKLGTKTETGTVIAADIEQLVALGIKRRYLKAVEQFWPGAVSVVMPSGAELAHLHRGSGGLAVRIPDDDNLIKLLRHTGPLLTICACAVGNTKIAATASEAERYFGSKVDVYVDGGDLSARKPSTIIRIVDDAIELIRPGAVELRIE